MSPTRFRTAPKPALGPALLLLVLAAVASGLLLPSPAQGAATRVTRGPTEFRRIALTFDDNYQPARALSILRVLKQYDVRATVFLVGQAVAGTPTINTALLDPRFEVGDHSWSHRLLTGASWATLASEIGGGTDAFERATGKRTVPLFRPPYGATNSSVASAAGAEGFLYLTLWDIDTNDWQGRSAAAIRDTVLSRAHPGAIVLMHLVAPHTAEALPGIITGLRSRGYELVTVSELLKGGRRFLDVSEGTAIGTAVSRLVGLGILSGYDRSYFGPSDPITRAQLAKVIVLAAGLHTAPIDHASSPTFSDVPLLRDSSGAPAAYPFDYIEEAVAAGLLQGRSTPSAQVFDPGHPLTRGQLAQIVARMARELKGYPATYGEGAPVAADVPAYAAHDVALTTRSGLMQGYSDRFDFWAPVQRGHVAVVMSRFLDLP